MKRIIFPFLFLFIVFSVSAMDIGLSYDPCIDFSAGSINDHISLGISTEVPFWNPTHLRIRYQYLAENDDDIEADLFSIDVVYAFSDRETSGYRFFPYIALGAHYLLPDHSDYELEGTAGIHSCAGCYYKIMPFHYVYIEGGISQLKYKPKIMESYTENTIYFNIGYKLVF